MLSGFRTNGRKTVEIRKRESSCVSLPVHDRLLASLKQEAPFLPSAPGFASCPEKRHDRNRAHAGAPVKVDKERLTAANQGASGPRAINSS